jgi:hypothetical protein
MEDGNKERKEERKKITKGRNEKKERNTQEGRKERY